MCPTGYNPEDGDIPGAGLTSIKATLDECKRACNERNDCRSFVHSISNGNCKLMAGSEPTGPKYGDYQFCSKGMFYKTCQTVAIT